MQPCLKQWVQWGWPGGPGGPGGPCLESPDENIWKHTVSDTIWRILQETVGNNFYRGVIKGDLVHDAVSYLPGRPGKPGGPGGPGGPGIPEAPPELNCPEAENKSTQSNERL